MKKEKVINVMKRYELKYHLSKSQLEYFMNSVAPYMKVDKYGLTSIASLYYDTPDFLLINRSIEKPKFKEKLRLRSYGIASSNSPTFLEIKRKCEGIVYKRRISLKEKEAVELISSKERNDQSQISRELEAFLERYQHVEPKYLIIYDRLAYYQENSDLRITIDMNPRYRTSDLNLHTSLEGKPLLKEGEAILEIKVQHSIPLWLSKILSEGKIYQSSFSKVGTAHTLEMRKKNEKRIEVTNLLNEYQKEERRYGFII